MRQHGLAAWAGQFKDQPGLEPGAALHGDWPRWQQAIDALPALGPGEVGCSEGAVALVPDSALGASAYAHLEACLRALHPWRKGPYRIGDLYLDSEWRSDWKWDRLSPHLAPLQGRVVLDVGCGNGYHCWRLALAGARAVLGIDPTALFLAQYLAIRRLLSPMAPRLAQAVRLLPLGIEAVPPALACFDTVLSMGVLYHRRSPIDHLLALRGALRPGGELVLETLVIDGGPQQLLVPAGRYAKMRNVWFIPSPPMLENWLRRCGFSRVRTVDVTPTLGAEQRSTRWMTFESLADFLDPADSSVTVEGHPAPLRAVILAEA